MKVISINDVIKNPEKENEERIALRKQNLLDILDHVKKEIEEGNLIEFVATSLDKEGDAQIHCYVGDVAVGVGLFEIGKNILMTQYDPESK
jgi:bifunctional N-acetylglucosamine-1-phosphate-uridyltransferase/glucosamine-1-phosphate-acetyltransferase GlmU-like protein